MSLNVVQSPPPALASPSAPPPKRKAGKDFFKEGVSPLFLAPETNYPSTSPSLASIHPKRTSKLMIGNFFRTSEPNLTPRLSEDSAVLRKDCISPLFVDMGISKNSLAFKAVVAQDGEVGVKEAYSCCHKCWAYLSVFLQLGQVSEVFALLTRTYVGSHEEPVEIECACNLIRDRINEYDSESKWKYIEENWTEGFKCQNPDAKYYTSTYDQGTDKL